MRHIVATLDAGGGKLTTPILAVEIRPKTAHISVVVGKSSIYVICAQVW